MTTTCKELFNKFNKFGGKITCNYEKQECTLFNNISCKINNKEDANELDLLIWNYHDTPFIKYFNSNNGFVIEFFRDKNDYKVN